MTASTQPRVFTTVVVTAVVTGLLALSILFAVLWNGSRTELDGLERDAADRARAEQVAADYAVAVATIDYRDPAPWRAAMVAGVTPELKARLEAAVGTMNQVLQPMQWVSTATLDDAVTTSVDGDVFTVSVYLGVERSTVRGAGRDPGETVYTITLDRSRDWIITGVGSPLTSMLSSGPQQPAPATAPSAVPSPAPGG
ncbi:hypothetical protein [Tsukamurella sp. 1534]|uniref:hypothetical protein n=1 Tax=Tsukamurella sp. 1534 TaxID=1151061 RepID=UPI0006ACAAD4|nr:hypothetical protein [Tsukamurella sp. 1534]